MDSVEAGTPPAFQHVLLPLDGSPFSAAALPTALALATEFGANLVTVAISPHEREIEQLRRRIEESVNEFGFTDEVDVIVGAEPAALITERANALERCLVCMSTRGRGRVAGALIGSVARAVVQSSRQPVVAVGPQADRPPALVGRPRRRSSRWPRPLSVRRVVACVDGSPESEAVLPAAAGWAVALDMRLSILTVAEDATGISGDQPNRFGPSNPAQYVEQLATQWRGAGADANGEVVFDPISAPAGVTAHLAAEPAGLVALTTHARSGLDRLRLGATAADIVRSSPVPTLVVPLARA